MAIVNWALEGMGAVATADSQYAGYPPVQAIDLNLNSRWQPLGMGVAGHWLCIALADHIQIDHLWVKQGSFPTFAANIIQIESSSDGIEWDVWGEIECIASEETHYTPGLHGVYIRLRSMSGGTSWWQVYQLELHGEVYAGIAYGDGFCDFPTIRTSVDGNPMTYAGNWLAEYGLTPPPNADQTTWAMLLLILCRIGQVRDWVNEGGEGGGSTDLQPVLDAIQTLSNNLDTYYTFIVNLIGTPVLSVIGDMAAQYAELANSIVAVETNIMDGSSYTLHHLHDDLAALPSGWATPQNILDAISSIKGPLDRSNSDNWNGLFDPAWGAIRAINDNTGAAQLSINGNVDAAESAILAAIAGIEPGQQGVLPGYPGSGSVTFGTPVPWSGPLQINQSMDGCRITISTQQGGTGKNTIGSFDNWKHAGWIAFVDDGGFADEIQWLGPEKANYCPKRLATASAVLLFPRTGSAGTLTPWTRTS